MTTNLNQIGKTILANTAASRLSIEATAPTLALISGVSVRTLQRMESARKARRTYRPALSTVVKLAAAVGVTVDEYIQGRLTFE